MTEQDVVTAQGLATEYGLQTEYGLTTADEDLADDRAQACHRMLLRLAGRAPDDLLTRSRDWLARGEFDDLARSVAFWVVSQNAVLTEADAAVLYGLLAEAGADPSGLTQITLDDFDPFPYYVFASEIPPGLPGAEKTPGPGSGPAVEQAAVEAVAAEPGAIGLWRAWRFPSDGAPWPPPKRVFVVEVQAVDEPGVAASLQDWLAAAGEPDPQVEVYQTGWQLPVYQEFARAYGELLWAAEVDPGIQVAAVFDEVDASTGPSFRADHPTLDESEVDKVVQYLYGGETVLVTPGLMDDVVDTSQLYCVPMTFRTDGTWIWTEASAYYAEQHRLQPDAGLLAHLRRNDYALPEVDGVAVYRAFQVLQDSADEELMWMFGSEFDETEPEAEIELEAEPEIELEAEPVTELETEP